MFRSLKCASGGRALFDKQAWKDAKISYKGHSSSVIGAYHCIYSDGEMEMD